VKRQASRFDTQVQLRIGNRCAIHFKLIVDSCDTDWQWQPVRDDL